MAGPLLPHFLQFYEADENLSPPLKLEACARIQVCRPRRAAAAGCRQQRGSSGCKPAVCNGRSSGRLDMAGPALKQPADGKRPCLSLQGEGVRLVEPLQHLLAGVRRVLCAAGAGGAAADDEGGATAALRSRFAALRRRLAEGCLEDFQMDGSVGECRCGWRGTGQGWGERCCLSRSHGAPIVRPAHHACPLLLLLCRLCAHHAWRAAEPRTRRRAAGLPGGRHGGLGGGDDGWEGGWKAGTDRRGGGPWVGAADGARAAGKVGTNSRGAGPWVGAADGAWVAPVSLRPCGHRCRYVCVPRAGEAR